MSYNKMIVKNESIEYESASDDGDMDFLKDLI